jgi:hypothetical protein
VREEDGSLQRRSLAFLLRDALGEQGPARVQLLRRLGDTSLFVSGFVPDCLSKGLVGVDYYIAMGGRAYDALSDMLAHQAARAVYGELSEKFALLVELLNEVSERTLASTNTGLVRLYERWMRTGGGRLGSLLQQRGLTAMALRAPRGRFVQ